MLDEHAEQCSQMTFAERNDPIKTFSSDGSDQPLRKRVRLRRAPWRLQNAQPETSQFGINVRREYSVAVMDYKSVRMIKRQKLPKLLDGPFGGRMLGHVE